MLFKRNNVERSPIPVFWTVVIVIAVITLLAIGAYEFTELVDRYEMKQQYEELM